MKISCVWSAVLPSSDKEIVTVEVSVLVMCGDWVDDSESMVGCLLKKVEVAKPGTADLLCSSISVLSGAEVNSAFGFVKVSNGSS